MTQRGLGRPDRYVLADGTRVPSVTTVISHRKSNVEGLLVWANRLGQEGKDHRDERDKAAGAGQLAHLMVENQIHGQDPLTSIAVETVAPKMLELAQQGLQAYLQWERVLQIEYLLTETPMVSEVLAFGGTPDAVGRTRDGQLALLDWKTSNAVYSDYVIQLAAYHALWQENRPGELIEAFYLLRFGKDFGDFHMHSYPASAIEKGWRAFVCLREVYDLDKDLKKVAT